MLQCIKIDEWVTIGAQPSIDDLRELTGQGFKSVVNLRQANEEDQLLSPVDEGQEVGNLGLEYLHLPVSSRDLQSMPVDEYRRQLKRLPKPVFVHCRSGHRASLLAVLTIAVEQGLTGREIVQKAEKMGVNLNLPGLRSFLENYCGGPQRE
jgi:uncharacterized protein (TIGR01244 family)